MGGIGKNLNSFQGPAVLKSRVGNFLLLQRESTIPFGGQGVFMKKDSEVDRVVALFSGYFFDYPEEIQYYDETCVQNTSLSDDHRRACKKYSVGLPAYKTMIEYPPELDKPGVFHPTMAQKVS